MTKKAPIIHRRQLFDGRTTAEEVHVKYALAGMKCGKCKGPPAIRARVFAPVEYLLREHPDFMMNLAAKHDGGVPIVDFVHGKHVLFGNYVACKGCSKDLEKNLAKAPSFFVVEINRGPGPEKPTVQVG